MIKYDLVQPDDDSYNGTIAYGLTRTAIPTPIGNQVKYYNRPVASLDLSFSMINDDFTVWYDWIRAVGYSWFLMDVVGPFDPVNVVSEHTVRVTSGMRYIKQGDNWLTVSIGVEILQADAEDINVPTRVDDWIIAGTPAAPSTDWVIAGTPAAPSSDWIRAELYRY